MQLKKGPVFQLIDFGLSKAWNSSSDPLVTYVGTPVYMAPEIIRGQPYDEKIDVWAIGVLAYFLSTQGKYPFPGITKDVVDNKILNYMPAI